MRTIRATHPHHPENPPHAAARQRSGMCGRGVINDTMTWAQVLAFHAGDPPAPTADIPVNHNIAPTNDVPILRADDAALAHWGLVPGASYPTFNARSETAHDKPTFRDAIRKRRCVIPFSGYYEWDAGKQPHYISRADDAPLFFAGLWSTAPDTTTGSACTILTCEQTNSLMTLHPRSPCVLEPESIAAWLADADPDTRRAMLAPPAEGVLKHHPVSKRVGNVRNNGAALTEPAEPEQPGLFG